MHYSNCAFNLLMTKVGKSSVYHSPLPQSPFASSPGVYNVPLFPEQLFFLSPHLTACQGNTKAEVEISSVQTPEHINY